jgi:2-polyprenyl-6-methoxyphenol hydroxylase-like FAD-dependent oxidoreductase
MNPQQAASTVLVVGAGPVGLTMATHLHHLGIACRIIDKNPSATDKSKALVLWGRTQEMLDNLGLIDTFAVAGMFVNGARFYNGSQLLAHIQLQVPGTEYPRGLMLAQSETERLLSEHLAKVGITIERSTELTDFSDDGNGVNATLRCADGQEEKLRCDWLLGCDGAHSTVRKKLGLEFAGAAEPNDWLLVDCRVEGGLPLDCVSLFWHQKGVLAFFPFTPTRCRMIADLGMAHGEGKPPDPTLEQMQTLLDERGPGGWRLVEPHWLAGFRINERKVGTYSRGRAFLAGDAAHIHSPAGGQGMNTGMQDAWNLAWKLALVQTGKARPTLLDSYTAERSAVGELVLRDAGLLTQMATLRNPVLQFARNLVFRGATKLPPVQHTFARKLSEMAIHYPDSPLNGESTEPVWASGSVKPGDRFPESRLRSPSTGREERLLRLFRGGKYSLLLLPVGLDSATLTQMADIQKWLDASYPGLVQVHVIVSSGAVPAGTENFKSVWLDPEGVARRELGAREPALALVRPDGYLGYRGQPLAWEGLNGYLQRFLILQQ